MGRMLNWRKSSYSFSNGNCAEVASWRKSTASAYNGSCVEVGHAATVVAVRDSQLGDRSPVLEFPAGAWSEFITRDM